MTVLLSRTDAAKALAISLRQLQEITKSEGIPVVPVGKKAIRYRPEDLHAFAANRARVKPCPEPITN